MDNRYTVTSVDKGKAKQNQPKNLYFKLLELKQKALTDKKENSKKMIKINNNIPFDKCLNQIRVTLAQHGFKNDGKEENG